MKTVPHTAVFAAALLVSILEARSVKKFVGVTVTSPEDGLVTDGSVELLLQGPSFSEGPGITDEVTVTLGNQSATAEVDNSRWSQTTEFSVMVLEPPPSRYRSICMRWIL